MKKLRFLIVFIAAFIGVAQSHAQGLAAVWHIPDSSTEPSLTGMNMRNPEFTIGTSTTVTFYTGVWKVDNGNGNAVRCNQTGGTLYYKTATQGSWSSTGMTFYSNTTANQYWQASINCSQFNYNDTVQYFFLLTFDGSGTAGSTNTWLYGNNAGSSTTGSSNTAAGSPFTFVVSNNVAGTPVLTVNGLNADYTTEHLFVDEVAGDSIPVSITFSNSGSVIEADVFSNLNRRNRATMDANSDGIEDGIVPPDGNLIPTGDDNNYYKAYAMTNLGGGNYSLTLYATNCGAYRLTARYKEGGNTNWLWYGLRDHCIVVTPARARNITMYELDAMNIDAQGTNQSDRSTFTDLYNGPGSRPYDPVTNRFNLAYFQNIGVNWLWFQPIHPIGILNRLTNPNTGQPYAVGSPYSVKNFFQINPLLGKANTRDGAMQEFTNFVAAANSNGINVMLDEPFNHTSWDCELDTAGTNYFAPTAQPTNIISAFEARFYSRTNEYDQRASSALNMAPATDRYDFGKFLDTADVYFGRYAALVSNSAQATNYLNEADWFDSSIGSENSTGSGNGHFDTITQNVWRYFSDCILYWLDKTGCPSNTPPNLTCKRGIGGLRADFGQGLPPQCWEYLINKVRARKWDFVFLTESLDGGKVTYRSNRHFDVLNENLIYDLYSAAVASDYRNAFENRRAEYGQSLVLLNNVSHDETNYNDPFEALIRYMACSTVDGSPMIFYGQDLGISSQSGFDQYVVTTIGSETKYVPQTFDYNDLQPVCTNQNFGLKQLYPVYAGINQARQFSPALRSSNRYFLDQTNGNSQPSIYSVAKYVTANGAPNLNDVVFAFANLDRNNPQSGFFNINITQNGSNLFGIQPGRIYNVKNISAYLGADANRRNVWLWPTNGIGGSYGSNVLAGGLYVGLNPVPITNAGWTNAPFEAQYLKLYDVTPPPAPTNAPGISSTNNYVIGNSVTFIWPAVSDSQGGISGYHVWVGTTPGGSDVFNGTVSGNSVTVTGSYGAKLYATVTAINNASIESSPSSTSAGIVLVNPPVASMAAKNSLSWTSISGLTYQVWSTTNLSIPFTAYSGMLTAISSTITYTNSPTNSTRYFKIQLLP